MYRRTDGRIRTRKGMSGFGRTGSDTELRTDGFGHRRVCPDSDGRIRDGRIRTHKGMSGRVWTDGRSRTHEDM